jgi:uncharacterized repeat protein (TIGR03803 family)
MKKRDVGQIQILAGDLARFLAHNHHAGRVTKSGSSEATLPQPARGEGNRGRKSSSLRGILTLVLLCVATAAASPAATKFKTLVSVDVKNGINPIAVVQGLDGNLYGITNEGGANLTCNEKGVGCGEVFKMTPAGGLTVLYSFCAQSNCTDGAYPNAPLLLANSGNFYGTTSEGGSHGGGTLFEITAAGKMTIIYNFCALNGCSDGLSPSAPLIQAKDGNFYGTSAGNENAGGNIFKITPGGKLKTLHSLPGGWPESGLVQGTDGNFYGTMTGRSGFFDGEVYKITPSGTMTTVYDFCQEANCTDGAFPYGSLVQGANGDFYGTTSGGGANGDGEVYEVSAAGKLTVLHSFDYETQGNLGSAPGTGLVLATDGNFYGTTTQGGEGCVFGCGTIFKMTPAGKTTTLHEFTGPDGTSPEALFPDTSGAFFGVASTGGNDACGGGCGTIYSLSTGITPFVSLLPSYGKVGNTIDILGQGFTGATGVSFDGVAAKFDNVSDTYLTAVVPSGALTGTVTVATFTASYKSSQIFLVTPQFTSFSPASGVVGSTVTFTGVSLTQTTSVTIGGKSAVFKVASDTKVTATVPAGAKTGQKITMVTLGGAAVSAKTFAVPPFVGSFSPLKGPVGTEVTISGSTFTGATKVTFGGVAATSFEVITDSEIKALVPSGAKTGPIGVTTPGGTGTSKTDFTVTQ